MNAGPQPLALRQAALVVHAMSTVDREWLLRELPVAQRSLLQPLLEELGDIGIPQDPHMLHEVTLPIAAPEPTGTPTPHPLSAGSARTLVVWLRTQPVDAAARLLAASPAWRARIVRAMLRKEREALERLSANLPPAPELESFVLAAARRRMAEEAAAPRLAWLRPSGWWPIRGEQR